MRGLLSRRKEKRAARGGGWQRAGTEGRRFSSFQLAAASAQQSVWLKMRLIGDPCATKVTLQFLTDSGS
jgi:hypothetical protein